MPYDDI
jgi:dynein heavy chain, axonemal